MPLLLALSANSPFWQGRDTGLASARTPLFQAFPRVGIPRAFADYGEYVDVVDLLIRCDAMPEPTYLWWDVRPQPRFGTIEVRIMDAQSRLDRDGRARRARAVPRARSRSSEGLATDGDPRPEVLDENRFLAARDGVDAEFVDPVNAQRIRRRQLLANVIAVCAPHAQSSAAPTSSRRSPTSRPTAPTGASGGWPRSAAGSAGSWRRWRTSSSRRRPADPA